MWRLWVGWLVLGGWGARAVRVRLGTGIVEGRSVKVGDAEVNVFKSIPFAEPPIGDLRFQAPLPKRPWHGVRDGRSYSPACMSNTTRTTSPQKNVSEDCLYLNVFADSRCYNRACPVLFYIHGGAFYYDSAVMFNDTEIIAKYASHEIVFVVPAYRVGIFGFLDLGQELWNAPYNVGLLDQILALRWVHKEIMNFGGDRHQICLFGNSAGGTSIDYLMSSPLFEENAFQRAIVDSSLPTLLPHVNLNMSRAVVERLSCMNSTMALELECLKRVPQLSLALATRMSEEAFVEVGGQTDPALLPSPSFVPLALRHWKAKPLLILTNTLEFRTSADSVRQFCDLYVPSLGYTQRATYRACYAHYNTSADPLKRQWLHAIHARIAQINTQLGALTYFGAFTQPGFDEHSQDLTFALGLHPRTNYSVGDVEMMAFFPEFIRRFVRGERPTHDWPVTDSNGRNYYDLQFDAALNSRPTPVVGRLFDGDGVEFWLELLMKVELESRRNSTQPPTPAFQAFFDLESGLAGGTRLWHLFWILLCGSIMVATLILLFTTWRLYRRYKRLADCSIAVGGEGKKILVVNRKYH